jgi:hypothetical protein
MVAANTSDARVQRELVALRGSTTEELNALRQKASTEIRGHLDTLPYLVDLPAERMQVEMIIAALSARVTAIEQLLAAAAAASSSAVTTVAPRADRQMLIIGGLAAAALFSLMATKR